MDFNLKEWDGVVWIHMALTGGEIFWMRQWTFWFRKKFLSCWLIEGTDRFSRTKVINC
jgi:hypothetical protein